MKHEFTINLVLDATPAAQTMVKTLAEALTGLKKHVPATEPEAEEVTYNEPEPEAPVNKPAPEEKKEEPAPAPEEKKEEPTPAPEEKKEEPAPATAERKVITTAQDLRDAMKKERERLEGPEGTADPALHKAVTSKFKEIANQLESGKKPSELEPQNREIFISYIQSLELNDGKLEITAPF